MEGSHVNFAHPGRLPVFISEECRLDAVRVLVRLTRGWMPLFCLADEHGHLVSLASVDHTRRLVRGLIQALNPRLGTKLAAPFFKPVESRSHLEALVRYVLDQTTHHGIQRAGHPALWSGSSFPDLVGARLLEGFDARRLREALPRWSEERIFAALELPWVPPATDDTLRAAGLARVVGAAARAVGHLKLEGRTPPVVRARRTVARTARLLGFTTGQLAFALGCPPRTARHLATAPDDPPMARALRLQVALHEACLALPG